MTTTNASTMNARDCPNCGMPREDWPDDARGGYLNDGVTYCCQGCIEGPGCTCRVYVAAGERAPTKEELRGDPESAAFVQSLQRETKHIDPEHYGTDVTKGRPPGPSASND
jgi:hypothetical protein